jgi:hypothetical protein
MESIVLVYAPPGKPIFGRIVAAQKAVLRYVEPARC